MEATFRYIRSTERFHLYEAPKCDGQVQVVYIDKSEFVNRLPMSILMIVSTRQYSEGASEVREAIKKLEYTFAADVKALKNRLKELGG